MCLQVQIQKEKTRESFGGGGGGCTTKSHRNKPPYGYFASLHLNFGTEEIVCNHL